MKYFFCWLLVCCCTCSAIAQLYVVKTGHISFHSVATRELVSASSDNLSGIIDLNKKVFAFKVPLVSFMGFNNPLQKEHFNENYMESDVFPEATFIGKIIENIDLSKDGEMVVRAKGKLKIHGVEQERIIKALVTVKASKVLVHTDFTIRLADHNIKIPRIVYEKIATEVSVAVNASFEKRK